MIISNVTAYVNSYEYNGEVIVPSRVLTSTPQNEELNLAYAPNFQLKLDDSYSYLNVTDTVKVRFSYGSVEYTAYADIINRSANDVVTLQYVDGLTVEEGDEPEASSISCDPSPINITFIIENDQVTGDGNFSFNVIDDLENDRSSEATVEWQQISIVNVGLGEEYNYDREDLIDSSFIDPTYNSDTGKIEGIIDTNFFEPQWLDTDAGWQSAAILDVTVDNLNIEETINFFGTEEGGDVDPELSQSINNILGSNYDVINDMSEEDALAAANNILYGDEEPPK